MHDWGPLPLTTSPIRINSHLLRKAQPQNLRHGLPFNSSSGLFIMKFWTPQGSMVYLVLSKIEPSVWWFYFVFRHMLQEIMFIQTLQDMGELEGPTNLENLASVKKFKMNPGYVFIFKCPLCPLSLREREYTVLEMGCLDWLHLRRETNRCMSIKHWTAG